MDPRRLFLTLVLAVMGAASLTVPPSPPGETPPRETTLRVQHALLNGTDALLVLLDAANAGVVVHYRIESPLHRSDDPRRIVAEWNATEGTTRSLILDGLPRLLLVLALPEEPSATLHLQWAWHGRAHVLTAPTLDQLVRILQENPA